MNLVEFLAMCDSIRIEASLKMLRSMQSPEDFAKTLETAARLLKGDNQKQ